MLNYVHDNQRVKSKTIELHNSRITGRTWCRIIVYKEGPNEFGALLKWLQKDVI